MAETQKTLQQLFLRRALVKLVNLKTRDFVKVEGLRVRFDVTKTNSSKPNDGTVEIFNLNADVRKFCEVPPEKDGKVSQDGLYIELSAGYQALTRQIFSGYASGGSEYQSPDWISKFKLVDGKTEIRTGTFEKSYKAGTPMQTVVMDVVKKLGLPLGFVKSPITTDIVQHGLSLSGPIKDILDNFSLKYNFFWSIQGGTVQIMDAEESLPGTAAVISPTTGLLSSPIRTEKGLEFDTLLIPHLKPGGLIRLQNNLSYNGLVQINSVQFSGDTSEGDFKCHIESKVL
jgi:hypothetical protein